MKKLFLTACLLMSGVASALTLPIPAGYPTLLGRSCGGVLVQPYITGFDANGNVTGELYASTRCGGSGRGGGYHSTLYKSYTTITWDFFGHYLLSSYDGGALNINEVATDTYGNVASVNGLVATLTIYELPPNAKPVAAAMPSVIGLTQAGAVAAVKSAGLLPGISATNYPSVAVGTVFNESPASGTILPFGSAVTLYVNSGNLDPND